MENASKALIMAAGVLLGVIIISIGVVLFSSFSKYGNATAQKMESTKIDEWNNTYLKYFGELTTIDKNGKEIKSPIKVTAHDIISVVNSARQNNIDREIQDLQRYNENSYYVQVDVDKITNFEKKTEEEKNDFLKNNAINEENETKIYYCKDVKVSPITKRVMYVKFETLK